MHIKTTLRFHLTSLRMSVIRKITTAVEEMDQGETLYTAVGRKLAQPWWKSVWRVLKRAKTDLPLGLPVSLCKLFTRRLQVNISQRYLNINVC